MTDEPRYDLPCLDLPAELGGVTEREALLIRAMLRVLEVRSGDPRMVMGPLAMEIERDLARAKEDQTEARQAMLEGDDP